MKCTKCGKDLNLKLPDDMRGFIDGRCDCGKRFGFFHPGESDKEIKVEESKGSVQWKDGKLV